MFTRVHNWGQTMEIQHLVEAATIAFRACRQPLEGHSVVRKRLGRCEDLFLDLAQVIEHRAHPGQL